MSDFPGQEPDWPTDDITSGTPTFDSNQQRRSGRQSSQGSRPTTARGIDEAIPSDTQGIYKISNPPTPRTIPARPQLFAQGNYPLSASSPAASVSRVEAQQMYEVSKEIEQPIFKIVDIDRSFTARVLEGYIARGSSCAKTHC